MKNLKALLFKPWLSFAERSRDQSLQELLGKEPDRLYGRWDTHDYERNLMGLQARIGQLATAEIRGDHGAINPRYWTWQAWLIPTVAVFTLLLSVPGMQQRLSWEKPMNRTETMGEAVGERVKGGAGPHFVEQNALQLKFALLNNGAGTQGPSLTPGYDGMEVARGATIVFAVESPVPAPATAVSIHYGMLPKPLQPLVQEYPLPGFQAAEGHDITRAVELIEGPEGYLAFTPEEEGTYVFQITSDQPQSHGGFKIEVVAKDP